MSGRIVLFGCLFVSVLGMAQSGGVRRPRGIYAVVDIDTEINQQQTANPSITSGAIHTFLVKRYASILANSAVSGLTIQVAWSTLNPNAPPSSQAYDWSYLDDAFAAVALWNSQHTSQTPKNIQAQIFPGFFTPSWLLAQIPSCDVLFQTPPQTPASNCGKATFMNYFEPHLGLSVLPLPWSPLYKTAFRTFLTAFAAKYLANPNFVSMDICGPTAASTEMLLPIDNNTPNQTQFGGITPNNMWLKLLAFAFPSQPAYQNSDQAFIDEWNAATDMFGQIFTGVTLIATTGTGLPDLSSAGFTVPSSFAADCPTQTMDCDAEASILAHFADPSVASTSAKGTQESGLNGRPAVSDTGNLRVKWLVQTTESSTTAGQVLGGFQFATSFSNSKDQTLNEGCTAKFPPTDDQKPVGCTIPATCTTTACLPVSCIPKACLAPGITSADLSAYTQFSDVPAKDLISPEQALYNVLSNYFSQTQSAPSYGLPVGTVPENYLQIYNPDFLYATANTSNPGQVMQKSGAIVSESAQQLLNQASQQILAMGEAGPVISSVANAEGKNPSIAPNMWVEIKGANLAPAGDSRIWTLFDFIGNAMPTALNGVSVTVNGKSAFVYYISPTQVNILTPPDPLSGTVVVQLTNDGLASAGFNIAARPTSPSFFVFNGGPYVAATHLDGTLIGPPGLFSGLTTPAKAGETIVLYGNGFGSSGVVSGSSMQSGSLSPLPSIAIGGVSATVEFAGLVAPGEFQFNVTVPQNASTGDNAIVATYNGASTTAGTTITVQGAG